MKFGQTVLSTLKCIVFVLLVFIPASLSAQTSYTVTASKLNVRATASANGTVVGSLTRGEEVIVNSVTMGWAEIFYKGQSRYVKADYLQVAPIKQTTTIHQSQQQRVAETKNHPRDIESEPQIQIDNIDTDNPQKFKAWRPFIEVQPDIVCLKGAKPMIDILFGITKGFGEYVSGGLGLGVQANIGSKSVGMPIFARLQIENKAMKLTPELFIDAGYDINFNGGGAVRLNPTIGVKANGLYIGAGYLASITTGEYGGVVHCVNIKLGYEFSGKKSKSIGNSIKRFFKEKTYLNYELGGGFNIGGSHEDYRAGSNLQTLLSWNIIARPHWHTGLGAGFAWHIVNVDSGDGFDLKAFPLFWRNRVVLLSKQKKLRPFIDLDLGAHFHVIKNVSSEESETEIGPYFNFQVGAILKNRFNLSIGVSPCVAHAWEVGGYGHWSASFGASSLDMTLGVQF